MAMVRVGYSNVEMSNLRRHQAELPTSVNTVIDPSYKSQRGGLSYREFLIANLDNPKYYRIIPRGFMRNPGKVSIKTGINQSWNVESYGSRPTQAYLFPDSALINKPGKVLGMRGCDLVWPETLHFFATDGEESYTTARTSWVFNEDNKVTFSLNSHVTAIKLQIISKTPNQCRFLAPLLTTSIESRSANGPVGYILYKKKGVSGYVVRGFDSISNFALARIWVDDSPYISEDGKVMIARAHFGDL